MKRQPRNFPKWNHDYQTYFPLERVIKMDKNMKLLFSGLSRNSQRALILKEKRNSRNELFIYSSFCLGQFSNFRGKDKAQRESWIVSCSNICRAKYGGKGSFTGRKLYMSFWGTPWIFGQTLSRSSIEWDPLEASQWTTTAACGLNGGFKVPASRAAVLLYISSIPLKTRKGYWSVVVNMV